MSAQKIVFGSPLIPLKLGDVNISCYILENKTYLVEKLDFNRVLHYEGKAEDWISDILANISKFVTVPKRIIDACENPVIAQHSTNDRKIVKGIDINILIETCQIIVGAKNEGFLNVYQLKYGRAAQNILKHFENQNIFDLIDRSIGFEFYKENLKYRISQFLRGNIEDKAFAWTTTIPDAFFESLFEIFSLSWSQLDHNPKIGAKIIFDTIYNRLPITSLEQLRIENPKRSYQKANKIARQKLHPELLSHIAAVISLIHVAANDKNIFLQLLKRTFPKNGNFSNGDLSFFDKPEKQKEALTLFDQSLKKSISNISTYTLKKNSRH